MQWDLRLQPYKQKSLGFKGSWKLSPRFYGPFRVIQQVGTVAYKLELPPKAKMHHIFHVTCLKLKLGNNITHYLLLIVKANCHLNQRLLGRKRTKKLQTRAITEVLVQWHGSSPENATWESLYNLQLQFPHLVGKVL